MRRENVNELDRAFAQFVATGAPDALGRAYDLSAAELQALATRLVGDPVEAEDLVQATFIAAIESASTFGTGRRVMPWLVGILNNRVRRWRRTRWRAARLVPRAADSKPADVLQDEELQACVARALDHLPPALHSVLVLRLRHGMQPAEIAFALGRPPGTVRSQLARGLEQLRERLPRHLTLPAILTVPPVRGLAAIRTAVLAHGSAHPAAFGAATTTTFAGVMLMSNQTKLAVACAAALLFAVLAWWQAAAGDWPAPPRASSEVTAVAGPGATPVRPESGSAVPRAGDDEPQRRAVVGTALRVSVRSAGEPVGGACVEVRPLGTARSLRAITDASGVAEFDRLPSGRGGCSLLGAGVREDYELAPGTIGAVTLEAPRPGKVRGLVLLEPGGPAAGAPVWIGLGATAASGVVDVTTTGRDGTFELALWTETVVGARHPGAIPTHRTVEAKAGETVDIVLRLRGGGAALRGTVVAAADGRPIGGATIEIGDHFGWFVGRLRTDGSRDTVLPFTTVSDDDGRFEVDGLLPGMATVHAAARGYALTMATVTLPAAGAAPVALALDRGGRVHGLVTRADGEPARDARVRCGEDHRLGTVETRTDRAGRYQLDHVPAGTARLHADQPGWGQRSASLAVVSGGDVEWSPVLDAHWNSIRGRVFDERGGALADWWVLAHDGSPHDMGSPARTATDGSFVLSRFPGFPEVYQLRVHPPGGLGSDGRPRAQAVLVHPGVRLGAPDVRIVVPDHMRPTAWLRGRIANARPRGPAPLLLGASGTVRALSLDAEGRFSVGPLAPGCWRVALTTFPQVHEIAAFDLLANEARDAGTIEIPRDGRGTVVIELPPFEPPPDFASEIGSPAALQVLTAGALRFVSWANLSPGLRLSLLPGRYVLRLCGAPLAPAAQECEVRAGEVARVTFDPRPGALRRVAFRHPGTDHPFEPLDLEVRDGVGAIAWNTVVPPHSGWWQFELNLVPGSYRLRAHTASGLHAEADLVVDAPDPGGRPHVYLLAPER